MSKFRRMLVGSVMSISSLECVETCWTRAKLRLLKLARNTTRDDIGQHARFKC